MKEGTEPRISHLTQADETEMISENPRQQDQPGQPKKNEVKSRLAYTQQARTNMGRKRRPIKGRSSLKAGSSYLIASPFRSN